MIPGTADEQARFVLEVQLSWIAGSALLILSAADDAMGDPELSQHAKAILERFGVKASHLVPCAKQIMRCVTDVRAAMQCGDMDKAIRHSLYLGALSRTIVLGKPLQKWLKVARGGPPRGRPPHANAARDRAMADEYLRRRADRRKLKATTIKAEIGKRNGLKRSQAIFAINRELERRKHASS